MPKGPSSFPKRDPFEEDDESEQDQTALESGWEDEASTTVAEQGDVAEKIRSLGGAVPKSSLILDEPTVDDRRANGIVASSPRPLTSTAARLVITAGNDKGALLAIQPGKSYTVGRGVDNDLVLTDIAVSRKHFDLKHDAGAWVLVDRRSGNGTLVNGTIEDNAFMLANGDVIEIGNTTFRFEMPNGLPRAHPAAAMETPATASMDASMDASLANVRVPVNRRPTADDDDDDEQSTVAGKQIREEMAAMPPTSAPQPPPPRARPPTSAPQPPPPPAPPAAPAPRARPATGAPHLAAQSLRGPAPMPYATPNTPTILPPQQQPRFEPQAPTILGDAMGMPSAHALPQPPQPPQGLYNTGYPAQSMAPGMSMHPSMPPQYGDYGMRPMAPYTAPPRGISRRTKLVVGAAGLAIAAAILTVVIIQAATSESETEPATTEPTTTEPADTKPATSAAPSKPTVEPIPSTTPSKPTVEPIEPTTTAATEPIKTEPATTEPPTTEPVAVEPAKTEPAKPPPVKTEAAKPPPVKTEDLAAKREREAAARKAREEAAAAKREREAAARKAREEAAARKRAEAAASTKRVATDSSGVKDKADGLYRGKNFAGAASALKAAAKGDDASELKSLAAIYENLGKAYNVGMAPGTPPKQAFDLLVKAKNFDNRAGGAFTGDITAKLAEIAPKAAVAFMADKDYVRARNAVAVAESGGKGNSSTQGVKASLESVAGKLFKEAQAELDSNEKSAREKLKQVQQMVDAKSQWHQKAGKLLSGG